MCALARAISGFLEFSRAPSSVECVQTEPQALTNLMTNDVQVFAIDPAAVTAVHSALQRLASAWGKLLVIQYVCAEWCV